MEGSGLASSTGMAQWIPLMDYAVKYGVSLSTLRRYIKANKIPYKIENGRYLLREDASSLVHGEMTAAQAQPQSARGDSAALLVKPSQSPVQVAEVERLKTELRKAREEIAELKMLVALYEDQIQPEAPTPPNHRPFLEV